VSEFGNIFDFELTTMVFSYGTIGFIAAYALFYVWAMPQSENRGFDPLPAA
jgi:hypothetical protein